MNKRGVTMLALLIFLNGCSHLTSGEVSGKVECESDSDCVPQGCSSQICASKDQEIITTCEYREEYECLEHTSCGCVDNKCQWSENKEYVKCLEGVGA